MAKETKDKKIADEVKEKKFKKSKEEGYKPKFDQEKKRASAETSSSESTASTSSEQSQGSGTVKIMESVGTVKVNESVGTVKVKDAESPSSATPFSKIGTVPKWQLNLLELEKGEKSSIKDSRGEGKKTKQKATDVAEEIKKKTEAWEMNLHGTKFKETAGGKYKKAEGKGDVREIRQNIKEIDVAKKELDRLSKLFEQIDTIKANPVLLRRLFSESEKCAKNLIRLKVPEGTSFLSSIELAKKAYLTELKRGDYSKLHSDDATKKLYEKSTALPKFDPPKLKR